MRETPVSDTAGAGGAHPLCLTLSASELTPAGLRAARARHPGRALRAVVARERLDACRHLAEAGFVPLRATWTGEVALARADARALRGSLDRVLHERRLTIGPVPADAFDAWLVHHERCYEAVHRINPAAPCDATARRARFAGDDLVPELAFAVLDGEAVLAHASLRESSGGLELGWFGATPTLGIDAVTLTLALKALEVEAALGLGHDRIGAEYDSTDPLALAAMAALPIDRSKVFLTYQDAVPVPPPFGDP